MSMITEQVEELREEADFIIETLDMQYPTTIGVAKIMKRAADTIEQLATRVREDNVYQRAFEQIKVEIASQRINKDKRFTEEIWWNSALQKCLEIIDKHNPDKVGKEDKTE